MIDSAPFRPGAVVRIRGQRWIVVRHRAYSESALLEVSGCDGSSRSTRASFLLPADVVEPLPASRLPRVVRPTEWRHLARQALAEGLSPRDLLRTIVAARADVLPFQLEPALGVLRGHASRVLIADEVGLGKTVQAGLIIAELLARSADAHALVVTPAGLREQWRGELQSRFGLRAIVIDSAALGRFGTWSGPEPNPWRSHAVAIASIDYVKRPEVLRSLEAAIWDAVIFDEAHELSGRSDRAAAASVLAERARILVLLSATPHAGDDARFAQLCALGDFTPSFPLMVFRRSRHEVGLPSGRRVTWLRVRLTPEEAALHSALMSYVREVWNVPQAAESGARLAMTVLVRRACSSAASLARSVERRLALRESSAPQDLGRGPAGVQTVFPWDSWPPNDDDEPAAVLTAAGFEDAEREQQRLRDIFRLAQDAREESKIRALSRLLRRAQEPAIVFTQYRDTLGRLASYLHDFPVVLLHGGLTPLERSESIARFTQGKALLLLATDAASQGLNLQHRCRLVVNLELPWSPLRLEQRIGRVDRLGQRQNVHAIHFIARGTAEETTVARLLVQVARMQSSIAGLQNPIDENVVAQDVIEGQQPGSIRQEVVLPPNVILPNLQVDARNEADRAASARRLIGHDANPAPAHRPIVTRIRRRSEPARGYWLFRLGYEGAGGSSQSDVMLGLTGPIESFTTNSTKEVREQLTLRTAEALSEANRAQRRILLELQEHVRTSAELATRRELAVLDAIRQHHARVAAQLLQPGLFDRRVDRAAAAQSSILRTALASGAIRLRDLERNASLRIGACDLVFAVLIG